MSTKQAQQSYSWVFSVTVYLKNKPDLLKYQMVSLSSTGPGEKYKDLTFSVGETAKAVSQLFEVYLKSQRGRRDSYNNQTPDMNVV